MKIMDGRLPPLTVIEASAGTGKTFLAVAMAVRALREKQVSRIILTRPAIEAGEKLGFLPGDLQSKVDPYLRPLHDALYDMFIAGQPVTLICGIPTNITNDGVPSDGWTKPKSRYSRPRAKWNPEHMMWEKVTSKYQIFYFPNNLSSLL